MSENKLRDLVYKKTLIDLLIKHQAFYSKEDAPQIYYEYRHAIASVVMLPPVDAVEVVRCKDCKHRPERVEESDEYEMDTDLEFPDEVCPCQCDDYYYSWMPKDDWFCANGERKEK